MIKNNKNFRYLIVGRYLSNIGDSVYNIVLAWYIMQLTGSSFWVGIFNAALFIPTIFSFLFGNIIDNNSKKKLLVLLAAGQSTAVFFIILTMLTGQNTPGVICFLVFVASIFSTNTYTVQDAYIPKIVEPKDLEEASRIKSISYKVSDYIFNAISGFLLEFFSSAVLLVISVVTLTSSALAFMKMEDIEKVASESELHEKNDDILKGFSFLLQNKIMLVFTVTSLISNFFFGGYNVYIVLIADEMNSPVMLGLINSVAAIGAFLGAWIISGYVIKNMGVGKKRVIARLGVGIGIALSGFAVNSWLFLLPLFLANLFLGVAHVTNDPIMQSIIPAEDMGKVLTAYYSITVGVMPLGSLFFGYIANYMPAHMFMYLFGFFGILDGLINWRYKPIANFVVGNSE